jgi:hypothetical protein
VKVDQSYRKSGVIRQNTGICGRQNELLDDNYIRDMTRWLATLYSFQANPLEQLREKLKISKFLVRKNKKISVAPLTHWTRSGCLKPGSDQNHHDANSSRLAHQH